MDGNRLLLWAAVYAVASALPVSGAHAGRVAASSFGWNPADATKCLQAALDSGAKRIVVDRQASEWLVETVKVPSNVEIVFADGVSVRAKPGSMVRPTDCLFRLKDVTNVVMRGEGNARLAMNRSDYLDPKRYRHAEWRHLLSLHSVDNVKIRDLSLEESGGDGVYLLKARNVVLENLFCKGHARHVTRFVDDCAVRLGSSTMGVYAYDPEMVLVEKGKE